LRADGQAVTPPYPESHCRSKSEHGKKASDPHLACGVLACRGREATMELLPTMVREALTQLDLPERELLACLEACLECSAVATLCADACMNGRDPQLLRKCVRLNLDVADTCGTLVRQLCRAGQPEPSALRALLEATASQCRSASIACAEHAPQLPHCGLCVRACEACVRTCTSLLEALLEAPSA
jgi:hypothetical protein